MESRVCLAWGNNLSAAHRGRTPCHTFAFVVKKASLFQKLGENCRFFSLVLSLF